MRVILMGAPGAGKGTQAQVLSEKLKIPSISTGNILREAIAAKTELGLIADTYMTKGNLVPDDIVVSIVKERLNSPDCQSGFILDGFPRTMPQAQSFKDMGITVDYVVSIEISDDEIISRMTGRRCCLSCGTSYHVLHNPPKQANVCDKCGSMLVIRDDDKAETVLERIEVYHKSTEPLKQYYKQTGLLVEVCGQDEIATTSGRILKALGI